MNRKIIVMSCIALILVMGVTTIGVSAQESEESPIREASEEEIYEYHLGDNLRVVDYHFDSDGVLNMTLESEGTNRITLTQDSDQSGFVELNRESHTIRDGRTTIEFDTQGSNALTVDTDEGLIGLSERSGGLPFSLQRSYSSGEVIIFGVFSGAIGIGVVMVVTFRKELELVTKVERVF